MEVLSSDFEAAAAATSRRLACVQSMLTPRGGSGSGGGGGGKLHKPEADSPSSLNLKSTSLASRVARAVEVPSTEKAIRSLLEDAERQQRLKTLNLPLADSLIELAEIQTGTHFPAASRKVLTGPHAHGSLSMTSKDY